ncbi:MAG: glycosyltransferase [Patescibacteria group bacterium]|nr:glycosyltransferase [Patescibacteria group bacterium]
MKLAFVYDRINKLGGAEKILLALHQAYPQAPFFTAVYNPDTAPFAKDLEIKASFLNYFPLAKTHHELYPWLTSMAFESFNFNQFDVVVSITSAEAKAIITQPKTLHLCYCLTPTRYLWSHRQQYIQNPTLGKFLRFWLSYLQRVDLINASRPDLYAAISQNVQRRIKKYYHWKSTVIYPPVATDKFSYRPAQDYFLLVSRLVGYKNIRLAIRAFNQLQKNLIIVGSGREESSLKQLAGPTIKFKGQVSDQVLIKLYQHCQALIMPQVEDFGIVSLEAQASGKPVIAFQSGGARETVINKQTGIFISQPTVDSLVFAMKQFNSRSWNKTIIQTQAKKFATSIFINNFKNFVEAQWQIHQKNFQ